MNTQIQLDREATLVDLANAYQRRDLAVLEAAVSPDMALTLAGGSRLAGTYRGIPLLLPLPPGASGGPEIGRQAHHVHPWRQRDDFRQIMIVMGPEHEAEMTLVVTMRYDDDSRIQSFLVQPQDQGLFDHVVNTSTRVPASL